MASVVAWPTVALGEMLKKSDDWIDLDPSEEYAQVTVRLWGKGVGLRGRVRGAEVAASRQLRVRQNQFILSRIDARNGAFGLVPADLDGAIVSNDFPAFDVNTYRLDPSFLQWMSRTHDFVELCQRASEGTTNRVRLQESRFLATEIPLPPLDEQRRIVARIEALAARIEQARALRREALAEAEALWGSVASSHLRALAGVPHKRIVDLAEVRGGIQKGPQRAAGANPVRYLTVAHVQRNHISLNDPRYFEVSPDELERWLLQSGDVLIVEGNGSSDQIGRTALFHGEIDPCVHQNHLIRIRPDSKQILPAYLNLYLNSPDGQEEVRARSRTTSGLNILSIGRISDIVVPVPPLDKQRSIIDNLDDTQARIARLKGLQAEAAAELDALLPSILDQAFRGEL